EKKVVVPGLDTATVVRQLALFVGMAASVAIGVWVVLWSWEPNYSILYGSLDQQEASQIMDALQQLDIEFKTDDSTGAVLVPTKKVHNARIRLAAQGLPKGTVGGIANVGDGNNDFFVSGTAEKARYKRALEIELSKTIATLANVKHARIHIAIPTRRLFVRDRNKPRAAVVLTLYPGRAMDDGQVAAIAHMVSASVPNLTIDNVTVVDQKGRLLTSGESTREMALTSSQFEFARRLEKNYVERIETILAPILGADAVRAQVTADIDFTFSEQTQETFNPDTPIARSIETLEEFSTGGAAGGIPGALSNQPPGESQVPEQVGKSSAGKKNPSNRSRKRETRNFELDKTVSVTRFAMGRLRRLSAAVVVDDMLSNDDKGAIVRVERSPEELERITELAKKAIGFNLQRGDSINIVNSPFTVPVEPEPLPEPAIWEQAWVWDLLKQVLGGLMVVLVLLGVLKPAIKTLSKTIEPMIKLPPAVAGSEPGALDQLAAPTKNKILVSADGKTLEFDPSMTPYEKDMATAKHTVKNDPKLVANVVKNWVTDDG
ncbi:MAG: flagellar basal-body MS-ring/collar protein FliF, partial [Thiohalomonadales bacterium]